MSTMTDPLKSIVLAIMAIGFSAVGVFAVVLLLLDSFGHVLNITVVRKGKKRDG